MAASQKPLRSTEALCRPQPPPCTACVTNGPQTGHERAGASRAAQTRKVVDLRSPGWSPHRAPGTLRDGELEEPRGNRSPSPRGLKAVLPGHFPPCSQPPISHSGDISSQPREAHRCPLPMQETHTGHQPFLPCFLCHRILVGLGWAGSRHLSSRGGEGQTMTPLQASAHPRGAGPITGSLRERVGSMDPYPQPLRTCPWIFEPPPWGHRGDKRPRWRVNWEIAPHSEGSIPVPYT